MRVFSASVVKLLGIANAIGVGFGFCDSCQFFSGLDNVISYDKSKPFFDYEATVGSVIAVMKKTIKASGSESGFKAVASRKKRKSGVLEESIDNKGVVAKTLGARSWGSETDDTTESENINMEEECLVEKTSIDYDDNGTFVGEDSDQTPKGLHVKTKKVLGKPLGVIDYNTVDAEDNVLDDSLLLSPPLPVKPSVQVPVHKFFILDIDLVAVAGKSFQKKVNFVRKIFSSVNGFGGAFTSSKFGGIIWASFTFEKVIMAAAQLANNRGVVVNTDLKHSVNNHMNQAIVLKKIPVETSVEAVHAAISEFGADFLTAEWSILIGKDAVCMAWTDVDKKTWDARDEFRALLYILPMSTNAHDLWDFIGSIGGKTCVIECSSGSLIQAMVNTSVIKGVGLRWSHLTAVLCSIYKTSSHTSLTCHTAGVSSSPRSKRAPFSAQDQFCLAKIYEKKSAPISHPLAFGGKTWAFVVGRPLPIVSFGGLAQSGSISYGKPFPTVNGELKDCLKNIESSLVSLTGQIGELAKRLDLFMLAVSQSSPGCQLPVTPPSQNQGEDIVMEVGLGDATSDKTAAILGLTASSEVVKLENMLEDLSASVMSLSACLDSLKFATCNVHGLNNSVKQDDVIRWHKDMDNLVSIFMESKLKGKVCPWLADKFDAKHVCKISEMPGRLLSIKLLFKNKLSMSILGLYAGASLVA
ncbi:hypothetical protein G9A89_019521 [Geosiphon pyriformis]|nr:hypothetical protein G9A89_019521 [Geosiphon pyriformis]